MSCLTGMIYGKCSDAQSSVEINWIYIYTYSTDAHKSLRSLKLCVVTFSDFIWEDITTLVLHL